MSADQNMRALKEVSLMNWGPQLNLTGRLKPKSVYLRSDGLHLEYRTKSHQKATYLLGTTFEGDGQRVLYLSERRSEMSPRIRKVLFKEILEHAQQRQETLVPTIHQCTRTLEWLQSPTTVPAFEVPDWAHELEDWMRTRWDDPKAPSETPNLRILPLEFIDALKLGDVEWIHTHWPRFETILQASDSPLGQLTAAMVLAMLGFGHTSRKLYSNIQLFSSDARLASCAAKIAMTQEDWSKAFEHLRQSIDVSKAGKLREFASVAYNAKEYIAAGRAADGALQIAEDNESWWSDLLDILIHSGAIDVAQRRVDGLLNGAGASGETIAKAGQIALAREDYPLVQALAESFHEPSDHWRKERLLGARCVANGDYEKAIIHLRTALEAQPRDQETTLWLGEAYLRMGMRAEAQHVLARFDKNITAEHPIAKLLFAIIHLSEHHSNEHEQNTWYLNRAIAHDVLGPLPPGTIQTKAFDRERVWATIDQLAPYRGRVPLIKNPETRIPKPFNDELEPRSRVLGKQHLIVFESSDEVRTRLHTSAEAYPEVPYYNTYASEIALWRGDYGLALTEFKEEWERSQTRWSYVGTASSLAMLGHDEEAIRWTEKGRQIFVTFITGEVTHSIRGEAFHRLGNRDEALNHLEYAVEVVPDRASAWLSLALLYFDLNRVDDAEKAARMFVVGRPTIVWEAHMALGFEPTTDPCPENLRAILEKSLEMMAGNRSSHILSFYDSQGRWRVQRMDKSEDKWRRLATLLSDNFLRYAISGLFEDMFRSLSSRG